MTIQRSPHDKVNPYAMINRGLLQDPELSWAAKGFLCFLLTLSNLSEINISHLKTGNEKEVKIIHALILELINEGYCTTNGESISLKKERIYG